MDFKKIVIIVLGISVIGCSSMSKQNTSAISGVADTNSGNGQLTSALIGGAVGKSMDDADNLKMQQALNDNVTGVSTHWQNEHSGDAYTVTPVKNISMNGNSTCREYRAIAYINGKKKHVYGTACKQRNGLWHTVSSS